MRTVIEDAQGNRAVIEDGRVTAADEVLLGAVRAALDRIDSPLQYIPDPDYEAANDYVRRSGGRIVIYDGPGTEGDPIGTVY